MKSSPLSIGVIAYLVLLLPIAGFSNGDKPVAGDNPQRPEKPNVIIVMTDDQGYGELSFHGNPILKTPNLDQFAKQSLRLTDFHVAPMCTPTRGQLMTGIHAVRNCAVNVSSGRSLLDARLPTMANYFADAAYSTGIFGKWHLGDNYPYRPEDRGFQEAIWFPSSHINSIPDQWGNDYFDDVYTHNKKREQFGGYSTDVFFDNAIKWMGAQVGAGKPFFAYLPTNTPHQPFWAKEEDIKTVEEWFSKSEFSGMEGMLRENLVRYLAMIHNIDTNIGRLMTFLKKEGLDKNTIVIFTNDNGSTFAPDYYDAGMRGKKTQLWEGGHRVSFFIRWPGGGFGSPREINGVATVQDVLPTLLDLCNIVSPAPSEFDGINIAPVLRGESAMPEDRMVVINYSRMPGDLSYPTLASPSLVRREGAAVLWKQWRFLNDSELYDLASDPMQTTNVAEKHPKVVERMRAHLYAWWHDVQGNANVAQAIAIGNSSENPVKLTAVDWVDVFVDLQLQVREGVQKNSYWNLNVEEAGEYEFELRRWPRETGLALADSLPPAHVRAGDRWLGPGRALPISSGRMLISKAGPTEDAAPILYNQKKQATPDAKSVNFTVSLDAGPVLLHTWFFDEASNEIAGAYYVYVTRK